MAAPRVGVLALQGDVREHLRAFEDCGAQAVGVRTPDELGAVDALVLPGGESTTMGRLLEVFGLLDPLRGRLDGGLPVFATCAGLILMSRAVLDGRPGQVTLGALDVAVRRNGYGRQVDSFEAGVEVAGVEGPPVPAVFIRAPVIEDVGPDAEVVATLEGRPVAVRQGRHLGLVFHPELTGDRRLQRWFLDGMA